MRSLAPGLAGLADWPQFVVCKYVPKEGGKSDKIPFNPITMQNCDAHDSNSWHTAEDAINLASMMGDNFGVGFVFTPNDPFWFLDIDNCIDEQRQWNEISSDALTRFPSALVEISHSGKGLHIIGTGNMPEHGTRCIQHGMEFYTDNRFVALTNNVMRGDVNQAELGMPEYVNSYFPVPTITALSREWTTTHSDDSLPIDDDEQLIAKMLTSHSAMGALTGRCTPADLWQANVTVLSATYPDPSRDFDHSSADMALASHLAFWTGKNCERIEQLMRRSALKREKWDRRERGNGYLKDTIIKAVSGCTSTYGTPLSEPTQEAEPRTGFQLMTPENQLEYFAGMAYVLDQHKVFVPSGLFLKPDQFRAMYGGYNFSLDSMNNKTVKSAFEAFTESQAIDHVKVHSSAFRPLMPAGEVFSEEGFDLINTYIPIETKRKKGDPSRMLELLEKLLPDGNDRAILMAYCASLVQNPGVKFQWSPLIQGTEGNGKTALLQCIAHAVGWRYTHLPNATELGDGGGKFNKWMQNKLFIGIEEIYTAERHHIVEQMKTWTNSKMEVQGKGADQVTMDTPFNTIALSNHQDAMRITYDQRRWAVFWCAQQSASDLVRDGMDGNYFRDLYNWLRDEGYEIMNDYFRTYDIPDKYNPATDCQRAPITTSTDAAVELTLGAVEQEVADAIEEARHGFAGGWVSSIMLNNLLKDLKVSHKIPRNKHRKMLKLLGYDWHPGLVNGRVNSPIPQEAGKPKLFSKVGHINNNLEGQSEIMAAYCKAQGYTLAANGGEMPEVGSGNSVE